MRLSRLASTTVRNHTSPSAIHPRQTFRTASERPNEVTRNDRSTEDHKQHHHQKAFQLLDKVVELFVVAVVSLCGSDSKCGYEHGQKAVPVRHLG